jgi:hypothetical protein
MSAPKFPDVEVQLSGEDGNAYAVLGRVSRALRRVACLARNGYRS